jgi:ABC-type nitrate/sulfonate/bicarbonate transport system ATPase subunit
MKLLEARNLNFSYPMKDQKTLEVFSNFCLDIEPGRILTLLGPSGCGKSTLLKLLSGFLKAEKGNVLYNGQPLRGPFKEGQMIFQDSSQLLPWLSVADNILFPLCRSSFPGMKPRPDRILLDRLEDVLNAVGLSEFRYEHPAALSGGMKQRCALGRALMAQGEILFLDEPFGSLDSPSRIELQGLLLSLWKSRKFSVVFVTHDIGEALSISDTILLFTRLSAAPVEIPVALERPRDRTSPEFTTREWELYSSLINSGKTL